MKRRWELAAVAGWIAASVGCGTSEPARLCDGTARVVLGVSVRPPVDRILWGQQVLYDNGARFLYVTGDCRYYVSEPEGEPWAEPRQGTLTADQERTLSRQLHVERWSALDGAHHGAPVADGDILVLEDLASQVQCAGDCRTGVPGEISDVDAHLTSILADLWTRGAPVDTPAVWLTAVQLDSGQFFPAGVESFRWQLTPPIAQVAITGADAANLGLGAGTGLRDAATVAGLRGLRAAYRGGAHGNFWYDYLPATDESGGSYYVYFRDALPGEDEHGLVRVGAATQ